MKVNIPVIQIGKTLVDALDCINSGGLGICFVLSDSKLIGVITDGDIRRSILKGVGTNNPVESVMNSDYFSLPVHSDLGLIQKNLERFKYIPILDSGGVLVDIASAQRFHSIPLIKPVLSGNELEYVTDCISTGWISSNGKYVHQFEQKFGEFIGCENTLAVSNGSVALHLAIVTLGIGPGDEVIVPDLTFAASINSILHAGATPVLVDVEPISMTIDPELIEMAITDKTKAVMPVHLYGQPANMNRIMQIALQYNLYVIEDCAEAIGSKFQGIHVGGFGDAAAFSFFGNKTITTGEGGMVVFRESFLRQRAQKLRDHGMSRVTKYWHDEVGFNYRLTNIQSAIGLAQVERASYFVQRKKWVADTYCKFLKGVSCITLPISNIGEALNSYWIYTIILEGFRPNTRDKLIEFLRLNGVESRPIFFPMHQMPIYHKYSRRDERYEVANKLSASGISLPSSVDISDAEIEKICLLIRSFLKV